MLSLHQIFAEPVLQALFWSLVTISFYIFAKNLYRRWPHSWLTPLATTPVLIGAVILLLHEDYKGYIHGTGWLMALLGPATVAFAIPIYEQRVLIKQNWPILLAGIVTGSLTSMFSSWMLASLVGLDGVLRLSLIPRSVSTPFAMEVSRNIGGTPDLTAVFVVITGIIGAIAGDVMLARVRFGSALARGALFGVGAHGAGTAQAHQIGSTEGAIAGLAMVLTGLLNVLAAPLVAAILR